ncbi:SEUSS-like 2 [Actinidia rufa]|uniref:SEUSS-like 2 n=1 Tax=Actinidia rufa TaxID=165716 RepID=A0A7J0EDI1_9ERIC|nr:SEUSS-like 2 [Actinidia rufa]
MVSSRVAGGVARSSSSSRILFQGDGKSQVVGNSQPSPSFGNSSNSTPGAGRSNLGPMSGDASNTVLNSVPTSGPSAGASSLVTDANSGLSGGPHLQRNASFNTESYMRLPASPMSFSSNNVSISGSSIMDGSSVVQQNSNQDPSSQQVLQSRQQQGASSATSLPMPRVGQISLSTGSRIPGSFIPDANNIYQLQKKPRLDIKQDDLMQQQLLQQLLQRQDSMQLQTNNPQLQALIQQQRLRHQQQQYLQSIPPVQRAHLLQQQQQLQLRQQLQQQSMQPVSSVKRPHDNGVCSRRLMQYLYHQRQRPPDNTIAYWRKFVTEYYSPRAKKRWCLSLYDNVGHHSLGVFPQATVILSWEFCARRHEELLPRRLVASQVNQLLQVAQKCQSTIAESGSDGVSQQDLQTNSNMVVTARRQLARTLELHSLNDLGFSKRYMCGACRYLRLSGLKSYPRRSTAAKLQMQDMEQLTNIQGLPTDHNTLNKLIALHPGLNSQMSNNHQMVGRGTLSGSAQAALALTNYQNLLTRQNSMNSNTNLLQQEASSSSFSNSNQNPSSTFQGPPSAQLPGTIQNSNSNSLNGNVIPLYQQSHPQPPQGSQVVQQQTIHKLLQNSNGSVTRDGLATVGSFNEGGSAVGLTPSRSNNFKAASNSDSSAAFGNSGFNQKASDLPQNLHLSDELFHEFTESGFFSSDLDDWIGRDD